MNENNGLLSSEIKIPMNKIKTIIGIITGLSAILFVACNFCTYVVICEYFNYWGIDTDLFVIDKSNLINIWLLIFCVFCLLLFIFIFLDKVINSNKFNEKEKIARGLMGYSIYLIFAFLVSSNQLAEFDFTYYIFLSLFTCFTILFYLFSIIVKSKKYQILREEFINFIDNLINKNNTFKIEDVFLTVLSIIIALFLSFKIIGMIELWVKKDYRIIETNQPNECSVVLYSTKDYFIVSECEIDGENNKLSIYKNKVKKIDNAGIIANKRIFSEIEKK